ncbi:MAG: ABC transporter substrate-binding protein [Lachnospiraceae bacterium]
MKKRVLSLVLAAAMAASLTACGGSEGAEQTTAAEAGKTEAADAGSSGQEAADGTVWKIGSMGPLTGPNAIYGNAVVNGAQVAVDEINAAGGINGYQIEYKGADDESDAEKSINAYNSLKDWGMQILVGATTSNSCIAVAAKSAQDNLFQITPSGSAVECAENPNVFRVCFSDPDQGAASAKYIGEHKLATKVAVIYDSSDVYSSGIYSKFAAEAANQGLEIVAEEAFTADTNKDFTTQLQKAKDAGAELVFLPFYYTEAALVLSQANTMGWDPIFFGCDGMDGILGVKNFDTSLAEGLMLLTPFAADAADDLTVNFVTTYKEKYGDTPIQFAADAYDAVYAVKAAIEDAGATPDMSVSDICEAMKASMVKVSVDGLTGAGMTWNADGEPSKAPKAVKIENGAYVSME